MLQGQLPPAFDEVETLQVMPTYKLENGIFCGTNTSQALRVLSLPAPQV